MKARSWTLSATRDGYDLRLYEAPLWVDLAEWATTIFCPHTLDRLRIFWWLWEVPFGKPNRDPDDGFLHNSVMSKLLDAESWALEKFDRRWKQRGVALPVTKEQAWAMEPDWFLDIDEEDE